MLCKDLFAHGPLESLTDNVRMGLNGSAMHLRVVAAWHAYVFSNLVKRDPVQLPLAVSLSGDSDDEDLLSVVPPGLRRVRPSKVDAKLVNYLLLREAGSARGHTLDCDEQ